ncbi:hypothetical protein [Leisingera sp. ANG-Vp]|uniref:hypothetical protein n=1 Tax=Leisingera sp. ANG-Vp TaxID=1577896 RepID=UPI0012698C34|nr:hypothetical protein [Leisingera sp. ANG-Vp]
MSERNDATGREVVDYKDYITNVLYLQIDSNGNTIDAIAVQTNGAVLVPRVGEDVEVHNRTSGSTVQGVVESVKHTCSLSVSVNTVFYAEAAIYVR